MLTELLEYADCAVCGRPIGERELVDVDGDDVICLDCCFDPPEPWGPPYRGMEHEACDDHDLMEAAMAPARGERGSALPLALGVLVFAGVLSAVAVQIVQLFGALVGR